MSNVPKQTHHLLLTVDGDNISVKVQGNPAVLGAAVAVVMADHPAIHRDYLKSREVIQDLEDDETHGREIGVGLIKSLLREIALHQLKQNN